MFINREIHASHHLYKPCVDYFFNYVSGFGGYVQCKEYTSTTKKEVKYIIYSLFLFTSSIVYSPYRIFCFPSCISIYIWLRLGSKAQTSK